MGVFMSAKISLFLFVFTLSVHSFAQGDLTPPGAPSATMKTLDQIEPRTIIPSLPYTITQTGSYYLASNLVLTAANTNGIDIESDDVTIDLNGFALEGNASAYDGIHVDTAKRNLIVKNGHLRGWSGSGKYAIDASFAENCRFENLTLSLNERGISAGPSAYLGHTKAYQNNASGIQYIFTIGAGSIITECQVYSNSANGFAFLIYGREACVVSKCTVKGNIAGGNTVCISVNAGSTVKDCTVYGNTTTFSDITGINAGNDCTVDSCAIYGNIGAGTSYGISMSGGVISQSTSTGHTNGVGIIASGSTLIKECATTSNGDGIRVGFNCLVRDNVSNSNGALTDGSGIRCTSTGNRIENNLVNGNGRGIRTDTGDNIVYSNTAQSNSTNFSFAAGTVYGHVTDMTAGGDISATTFYPTDNFSF